MASSNLLYSKAIFCHRLIDNGYTCSLLLFCSKVIMSAKFTKFNIPIAEIRVSEGKTRNRKLLERLI